MVRNTFFTDEDARDQPLFMAMPSAEQPGRLCVFTRPRTVISAYEASEVNTAFQRIEKYSRKYYVAGFTSYELGYVLEPCFRDTRRFTFPLIYYGVFDRPERVIIPGKSQASEKNKHPFTITSPVLSASRKDYIQRVKKIKDCIAEGDIYQANLTVKYRFSVRGSIPSFFERLYANQPVSSAAFIKTGDRYILSLSPELFFQRFGEKVEAQPMKGTMPRGKTRQQDAFIKRLLQRDQKNRAENLMIVDLIRNDLSKISRVHSVRVRRLFKVEQYKTLFQMISVIQSRLRKNVSYYDIFKALFPCGSIVGAPKIRAMRVLKEIEVDERHIYCGSIGMIAPNQKARFTVAIRTILLDGTRAEMGVGSGIVWDSVPEDEYEECLLKGRFLTQLIEK